MAIETSQYSEVEPMVLPPQDLWSDRSIIDEEIAADHMDAPSHANAAGSDNGPPCFASGTLLRTASGLVLIDAVKVGDRVWTSDSGLQVVRWRGSRIVSGLGRYAPIRFDAQAFGNPRPFRVSPEHRVLVAGWRAQLWFGEDEVLVAAKHLVNGTSIRVARTPFVEYHHLLFDGHEIVESDGVLSESFHPGAETIGKDAGIRDELFNMFPELKDQCASALPCSARAVVRGLEATVLAAPLMTAA